MKPSDSLALLLVLALLLQGCAGTPVEAPKIERLSAAELEARLPQPLAVLPLEQVVALARQGSAAEDIIARIQATASRYRLTATQIVDLARQGVPLKVLDHMVTAERTAVFDDMAGDVLRREQACQERIGQEVWLCRSQSMQPMWAPWPQPLINCFPSPPGSPFWRCL